MADDTARLVGSGGIGYAHAMPPARQPVRQDAAVSKRWTERWVAWAAQKSKVYDDAPVALAAWRKLHSGRMMILIDAGLPWTTITRNDIDSPFYSEPIFHYEMSHFLKRRTKRMDQIKGQVKNRSESRRMNDHT